VTIECSPFHVKFYCTWLLYLAEIGQEGTRQRTMRDDHEGIPQRDSRLQLFVCLFHILNI